MTANGRRSFSSAGLAASLLVCASCGWAAPDVTVAVGGDVRWFDWREHSNGKQLLAETGPQAFGMAQVAVQGGRVAGQCRVSIRGRAGALRRSLAKWSELRSRCRRDGHGYRLATGMVR
jgi:hypothetical protein